LLIIYSPPCHPRCPCLSFFRRKEIKVFDENIPAFLFEQESQGELIQGICTFF